jgi:hypothetical protein
MQLLIMLKCCGKTTNFVVISSTFLKISTKSTTYKPKKQQKTVDSRLRIAYTVCTVNKKELKMTEFEKNCYGISEAQIREQYMESITAKFSGLEMVAMGVLSDAQELLAMDRKEAARKQMNIAKFILSEMMEARQSA